MFGSQEYSRMLSVKMLNTLAMRCGVKVFFPRKGVSKADQPLWNDSVPVNSHLLQKSTHGIFFQFHKWAPVAIYIVLERKIASLELLSPIAGTDNR